MNLKQSNRQQLIFRNYLRNIKTYRLSIISNVCEKMEKVWEELKKIESQAETIRKESQNNTNKITSLAQQEGEKLIASSRTYAEEEAKQLYEHTVQEANRDRDERLRTNQKAIDNLQVKAEKRIERASLTIKNAVLGVTKH